MKSLISTKSLRKVKYSLPKNGMEEIASRLNISAATVSRVLNNKNKKSQREVLECALQIIEEEKQKINAMENLIESL